MSKIIKKIKNEKLKAIVISISIVIFIIGIVVSITSTGNSYAASTYSCFLCAGGSSNGSNHFWGPEPDSSTCTGSWTPISASTEKECLGYEVYIMYSTNGGEITTPVTDIYGVTHNWKSVMMNGIYTIFDGNADYYQKIRYNGKLSTDGLVNYNNKNFINITRNGYHVTSGSEWICLNGCTTENKVFSQTKQYYSYDFCNAVSSDCRVVLGVNWQLDTYTIKYDANGGSGAPNDQIKKYDIPLILTTAIPTREGFTFLGWDHRSTVTMATYHPGDPYTANAGATLYAIWKPNSTNEEDDNNSIYTIKYDANGGSGAPSEQTKFKGEPLTLSSVEPTRNGYTFLGWAHGTTATEPTYHPGDPYTANAGATLYAVWKKDSSENGNDNTVSGEGESGSNTPTTYKVKIKYHVSEGKIAASTTSSEGTHSWTTTSDGIIKQDGNVFYNSVNYGQKINENGILDYNNPNFANIQKTGYTTEEGKEWICLSGCTTSGKTYNQKYLYNASDFCDAKDRDCEVTLGVNWIPNTYYIEYKLNGGTITGKADNGTYDKKILIYNPTKTVTLHGNENKTSATIGKDVIVEQEFTGWTSTTINEKTAYHGDTVWTDGNVKVKDIIFKNLTSNNNGIVTMIANWETVTVNLPTISKEGYTCNWNTKADGKGTKYISGAKYTIGSESPDTINLYAVCIANSKVDEEISNPPKTGDILIVIAWTVGIGALGYTVYYFRSRKSNI